MESSLQCQMRYVEEGEEYLVANRCHVHRKGVLENNLVKKKMERSGNIHTINEGMKNLQYRLIVFGFG